MAIRKPLDLSSGIRLTGAYFRIERVDYIKEGQSTIFLIGYADKDACDSGKESVYMSTFKFEPAIAETDWNFVKQGYEYLKTLEEFESAVDILEE